MSVLASTSTPLSARARPDARPDARLDVIEEKIARGERLTIDDGLLLYETPDVWSVVALADVVRRRLHGHAAYYNINRHLNYSNVCALSCKFCEFYRKDGDDGAYTRDMEYIREQARGAVEAGATEIHSVGGLHPSLPFSYYTDLVATIRGEASRLGSDLHVKAFTAVEIVHLARIAKVYKGATLPGEEGRAARRAGIRHVLSELKKAGLGSLPGGGAEVFDDRVHDQAYKGKIRSDVWLDVHRVAHELGLNTNATILYGHIESRIDRLTHMDMLRRAQDEALARLGYAGVSGRGLAKRSAAREGKPDTGVGVEDDPGTGEGDLARSEGGHLGARAGEVGDSNAPIITLTRPGTPLPERVSAADGVGTCPCGYYQTIIPLPFFPDGSELERLPGPSGLENLRTIAVSRLMLDNFPHVKAFWIMQTLPMSQVMLAAGADDIDGTVVWYDITKVNHGAGQGAGAAATNQEVNVWTLRKAIREAGFEPIERDTLYRRVIRDGSNGRLWRTEPFGVPPAHGIR